MTADMSQAELSDEQIFRLLFVEVSSSDPERGCSYSLAAARRTPDTRDDSHRT